MGPEWLQAYSAMLPRLIAQQQLAWLEVLQIPQMAKKEDIKRAIRSLKSKASGGSGEYNEKGQLQIVGASQLRAWFSQFGYST